ncbi:Crp/Fnr family transcriptional regulator [Chitinophaga sp. 30R24]|uniref:Crp/Fnr family transcriptional regulator n=1 Tax=Chitinophaga sp. 30R24 TaxID=3248838 RepID=UPI003B90EA4C
MPYQKITRLIAELVRIDKFDQHLIKEVFEPVSYRKSHVIVSSGDIARYMYFINTGYLRLYHIDGDGEEVTNHINCPMGFMTAFNSYITQTRSHEIFECITDCELLRITRGNLDELLKHNQRWAELGKILYEEIIRYNEQKVKDQVSLTTKQRYFNLVEQLPDIMQQVPLSYIASFMGIKPDSLSRIHREVTT